MSNEKNLNEMDLEQVAGGMPGHVGVYISSKAPETNAPNIGYTPDRAKIEPWDLVFNAVKHPVDPQDL